MDPFIQAPRAQCDSTQRAEGELPSPVDQATGSDRGRDANVGANQRRGGPKQASRVGRNGHKHGDREREHSIYTWQGSLRAIDVRELALLGICTQPPRGTGRGGRLVPPDRSLTVEAA
jgi:hypothetical protein